MDSETGQQPRERPKHFASAWLSQLARAQVTRPVPFVVVCVFFSAVCALLATRLQLRTRFEELLPEARASVVELKRLQANVPAG